MTEARTQLPFSMEKRPQSFDALTPVSESPEVQAYRGVREIEEFLADEPEDPTNRYLEALNDLRAVTTAEVEALQPPQAPELDAPVDQLRPVIIAYGNNLQQFRYNLREQPL